MATAVETLGKLERRITISFPLTDVRTEVEKRLKVQARTAKAPGFRPGKVPAKVIEQRFGPQVRAEALDGLLRETFDAALRQHELRIAGNPRID
ncbi:MAG: trigger factor family protein, partial [Janthinobacterium sp.]